MSPRHAVMASPIGPLTIVLSDNGVRGIYMELTKRPLTAQTTGVRDDGVAADTIRQLTEYFAGQRRSFELPLDLQGTVFQRAVWAQLLLIPYAERTSYGAIARALGDPNAVRAVGAANGSNPVSIVVPCHRVVGAAGALTGYAGGVERKRFLLDLESKVSGAVPALF